MRKVRAFITVCMIFLFVLLLSAMYEIDAKAEETDGYIVIKTEGGITCTYQAESVKDAYLCLVETEESMDVVSPGTKENVIIYFDQDGNGEKYLGSSRALPITYGDTVKSYCVKKGKLYTGWYKKSYYYEKGLLVTGWKKIKTNYYYFNKEEKGRGKLLTNTIAGTKKEGFYYVDSNGIRVTEPEMQLAVKFVNAHTKQGWSDSKKLKSCFQYLWKNYKYKRFYEKPKASMMPGYAKYMLSKKKGNCYRYASSFAYIARALGYETRVAVGKISSARGGMTPHGWTEVKVNGKWYMCDANMQRNYPKISSYMKTKNTYAYRHSCSKRFTMTVKNGKVIWK